MDASMAYQHILLFIAAVCLLVLSMPSRQWNGYIAQDAQGNYHLLVSKSEIEKKGYKKPSRPYVFGQKVNLVRASMEDLCDIPGIGPSTAKHLLRVREQKEVTWEKIDAIPRIGPKRLAILKEHLTLRSQ